MDLSERISAFVNLGKFMQQFTKDGFKEHPDLLCVNSKYADLIKDVIENTFFSNPWFIPEFIINSIAVNGNSLEENHIKKWLSFYPGLKDSSKLPKDIGVVMAGNIPMTGFHDFVTILLSGNRLKARLSSKDDKILPALSMILQFFVPEFKDYIFFEDNLQKKFDAIIATGSDNSARYFEYYFRNQPHIIRKNRNSVAILNGEESSQDLNRLADDIFLYFGLGCRSVSKIFVPENYDIQELIRYFDKYAYLYDNNKYANNYDYQRAVFLLNRYPFFDNGFLLLKESSSYSSPVGCLYYERFRDIEELIVRLKADEEKLQCIVTNIKSIDKRVEFGASQKPMLWEYADNIDTMSFLFNLA